MTHPADSLMAIFGFKRKMTIRGNVITPVEFDHDTDVDVSQCDICGDHDCDGGLPCRTGDGV